MKKRRHTIKSSVRRLYFAMLIISLLFGYLLYRLVIVQIIEGPKYKEEAIDQWTKETVIPAERGIIFDKNGKMLAVNITSFTLWAEPKRIDDPEMVALKISEVLNILSEEVYEKIKDKGNVVKIKQWITREEAEIIEEMSIKGISIVDGSKRSYPLNNFASYVLGFTDIDNNGLYGVEGYYNEELGGKDGVKSIMTDAANRPLPDDIVEITEPINGYDIVLSVDETIQGYAEKAAEMTMVNNKAKSVSIIVMDPHSGEVLAMVNKPDYNSNSPRDPIDEDLKIEWSKLSQEEQQQKWYSMWRNYAINDIYEPGSTYKIITAAAVLESGSATLGNHYFCDGFVHNVPGARLKCSKWYDPHGYQTFEEAFANSCNPAFVEMARQIGKEGMVEYTKKFGFGEVTGIDLNGEQKGIIPQSADKMREVNLATLSYGHGIAVTPIQMINAISAVANGGNLMTPRVVKKITDGDVLIKEYKPEIKNRVISTDTADKILNMLELAVIDGTGKKAYVPGYRVGGKTGTAQKVIDGRYVAGKYISSFGGVAPVDDPKITVLVIVDEPTGIYYGGTVAGPAAQYIIENTLSYMQVPKIYTDEELKNLNTEITIPDLIGMTIREAGETLTSLGLKYVTQNQTFTEDAKIIDHFPLKNEVVNKGSIIDLYLDSGERDELMDYNIENND